MERERGDFPSPQAKGGAETMSVTVQAQPCGPPSNPFVFVVGCPRSGTTLLRRILNAHSRLAIPKAETHWIPKLYQKGPGTSPAKPVTPALLEVLATDRRFRKLGIEQSELASIFAQGNPSYPEFVRRLFDCYGRLQGKSLVGDKTPGYARCIGLLHQLFPQARFIHLVRDGRDVALSLLNWSRLHKTAGRLKTFEQDPVTTTALFWEWLVRLGMEGGAALPRGLYHQVSYESLVADPVATSRRLCEFLALPYEAAMQEFYAGRVRPNPALSAKKAWLPPTQGLRNWRTQMPREHVELFEAAAGDLLEELGYARSHAMPSSAAMAHAMALRARFSRKPLPLAWTGN